MFKWLYAFLFLLRCASTEQSKSAFDKKHEAEVIGIPTSICCLRPKFRVKQTD